MGHYFDVGFSVRQPAWHGLATVVQDYPDREVAIKLAGHDFEIKQCPLSIEIPNGSTRMVEPVSMKTWKGLVRSDNNSILSVVRGSYQVMQNSVLWDIVDAIVSQKGVKYETAGVLKGGRVLWVLARLEQQTEVQGDNSLIAPYVLVSTTHDGTGACKAQAVSIRVICWNTFTAADTQANKQGTSFTFRHTKKVEDRIVDARSALGLVKHQHEAFIHLANELTKIEVSDKGVLQFVNTMIPEPAMDVLSDRQRGSLLEARLQILYLVNDGKTIPEEHRRTAYGLWAAGVEYLDHIRKYHNKESLFRRTMLDNSRIKLKLMDVARDCSMKLVS